MPKLTNKSLLLVFQSGRTFKGSLHEMIYTALSSNLNVDYLDIENPPVFKNQYLPDKIRNIFECQILNNKQFSLVAENKFINRFYLKQLNKHTVNGKKYDYVLIIRPEEFTELFVKKVSKLGTMTVGYLWDGLRLYLKPNLQKSRKYFDFLYSFDENNINEYPNLKMDFCTNFSIENPEIIPYENRKIDLFYIGDIAGRLPNERRDMMINRLLQNLTGEFNVNIWFRFPQLSKLENSVIKYITTPTSPLESFEESRKSKIVIDICKNSHMGLSFRFFECLFTETKIITNNKDVINYDFYESENIMIVDFDNDILDQEKFHEFLNSPYKKLSSNIVSQYSTENWVKYLYKIDGYKNIKKQVRS